MKRRNKLKLNKRLVAALAVLLAVGFAYISSAVNIGGMFTLSPSRYDVHFENLQVTEGSVEADTPTFSTNDTKVSASVRFAQPGDFYEFTIDAVNDGDIDAMLNTVSDVELTEEQEKYIDYSVTYEDGEELAQYQELNAGDSLTFKIRASFKENIDTEDLPVDGDTLDLTFDTEYIRADDNKIRRRAENTLYHVLKAEAISGGLAKKYTGEHQDSMDASLSTKDIYHWYATNSAGGTAVTNKNNVIFANHCWRMIRTTDTGGVKLLYNGEAENNKCTSSRSNHVGYYKTTSLNLSTNYWYGTDFIYDKLTNKFTISGITENTRWTDSTASSLIGKYTCKATTESGTCSKLYLISEYAGSTTAYAIQIVSNASNSSYGQLYYNSSKSSPAYVGYMYGNSYKESSISRTKSESFTKEQTLLTRVTGKTAYWYSDSIDWNTINNNNYTLINPYQVSSTEDIANLAGKYTFISTNENQYQSNVFYIINVNGTTLTVRALSNGELLSDYTQLKFGTGITDNGNGTYTINNTQSISITNWQQIYSNYNNYYTCLSNSSTCSNAIYITRTTNEMINYIDLNEKILIAKNRNGNNLLNTITIRKEEMITNQENNAEYIYTCNDINTTCSDSDIRLITSISTTGYNYVPNYSYGTGVTWNGTNYTLTNPIEMENYNNLTNLSTHHFSCLPSTGTICEKVSYIYETNNDLNNKFNYITIDDGESDMNYIIENMFDYNINHSTIKRGIDAWYKKYLINYDQYIEDTIYCNDRNIISLNGYSPTGSITSGGIFFKYKNLTTDLSCERVIDRFSTNNNSAKLTYKVGLITIPEIELFESSPPSFSESYWTMTPYSSSNSRVYSINKNGVILTYDVNYVNFNEDNTAEVHPVISLKPGTEYITGTGSTDNPYIVDTN